MVALQQVITVHVDKRKLKMLLNTCTRWSAQALRTLPGTLPGSVAYPDTVIHNISITELSALSILSTSGQVNLAV